MGKISIILIIMFISFPSYSQWIRNNDYYELKVDEKTILDYVISHDSKYIYTVNDSALLVKWDIETGDSISAINIKPQENLSHTKRWCFLSTDGRTYVTTAFKNIGDNTKKNYYAFIWDIATGSLIDSTSFVETYPIAYYLLGPFEFTTAEANYLFNQKTLVYAVSLDAVNNWHYYDVYHIGRIHIMAKKDTAWKILASHPYQLKSITYSDEIIEYDTYYTTSRLDMRVGTGSSSSMKKHFLFNLENDSLQLIQYFNRSSENTKYSETGNLYNILSSVFINDTLLIYDGTKLATFNTINSNFELPYIYYKEYPPKFPVYLKNSHRDDYYFIPDIDSLNIHKSDNHHLYRTIEITTADRINQVRNSNDSLYVIVSDYSGNLYKLRNDEIFKLKANFWTEDTIYTSGDTIKFEDLSLGEPTEYLWDFGDGSKSSEKEPLHVYNDTGFYSVKLKVKNSFNEDSIVKNNHIYILPDIKLSIDYQINIGDTSKVIFRNTSEGVYDSLKWYFEDKSIDTQEIVTRDYYIKGTYPVTLKLFRSTRTYELTENVNIDMPERSIDKSILIYEFTDTAYAGYQAYSAFDDKDNNLIYHIKDEDSYYGLMKSTVPKWAEQVKSSRTYVFRKGKNLFSFACDSVIYNFDIGNNKTSLFQDFPNMTAREINCKDTNIVYIRNVSMEQSIPYFVFNIQNEIRINDKILEGPPDKDFLNFKIISTNGILDILQTYNWTFHQSQPPQKGSGSRLNIYPVDISMYYLDMIRINEEHIVVLFANSFRMYKQTYTINESGEIVFDPSEFLLEKAYSNVQFNNIIKISNHKFLIAGESQGHPAYWLFNSNGDLLRERIFTVRYGSFNSAFKSFDKGILLSGWRTKEYPNINPYYLKIFESHSEIINESDPPDTTKTDPPDSTEKPVERFSASIINHYVYPNPSVGECRLVLESNSNTTAIITIHDYLGNAVSEPKTIELKYGMNEETIILYDKSIGNFFYRINTGSEIKAGRIINLR